MILAVFEVARLSASLQMRSRLYQILLAMSVTLPWALCLVPGEEARGSAMFMDLSAIAVFTILLPFVTLYLSVQSIHGDIEDRTVTYLFTRPVSRLAILAGKLLAVMLCAWLFAALLLTTIYAAVTFTGIQWRGGDLPSAGQYGVLLLGGALMVAGYSGLGALLAAFFRRPMLMVILLLFVEQFVSRLPRQVGMHDLTINSPVRRFMVETVEAPSKVFRGVMVGNFGDGHRRKRRRRQESSNPPPPATVQPPQTPALLALLRIWGLSLAFGAFIYSRREYDSRPRE